MPKDATGPKRGPKGAHRDYGPALRAMVPLVLGGQSVLAAARQVVDLGLVPARPGEQRNQVWKDQRAHALRGWYPKERDRLVAEYEQQQREREQQRRQAAVLQSDRSLLAEMPAATRRRAEEEARRPKELQKLSAEQIASLISQPIKPSPAQLAEIQKLSEIISSATGNFQQPDPPKRRK